MNTTYIWQFPLKMPHSRNLPNPETQISWYKFKLDQHLVLNLYRKIPRNLSFSICGFEKYSIFSGNCHGMAIFAGRHICQKRRYLCGSYRRLFGHVVDRLIIDVFRRRIIDVFWRLTSFWTCFSKNKTTSHFEFVPRDTAESEFLDLTDFGGEVFSVESVVWRCLGRRVSTPSPWREIYLRD